MKNATWMAASLLVAVAVLLSPLAAAGAPPDAETTDGLASWPRDAAFRLHEVVPVPTPWVLREVRTHSEFLRLVFTDGQRTAAVEIAAHDGPSGPWQTTHYRVQPAPGSDPPRRLLEAVMTGVRRLDGPGHAPFVEPVEKVPGPEGRLVEKTPLVEIVQRRLEALEVRHLVLGLDALALLLFLGVGRAWAREDRAWRGRLALGAAVGAALVTTLAVLLRPADLPISWITILHEAEHNVEHLYVLGEHRGMHHRLLLDLVRTEAGASLRTAVWLHLVQWAAAGALFFLVAWRVLRRASHGLALALVFLLNPISLQAALSMTPSALLGLLFVLALPPMALLARREAFGPLARTAALLLVATLTVLATLARKEAAILFGPALLLASIQATAGRGPLQLLHERVVAWFRGALGPGGRRRRIQIGLVLAALFVLSMVVDPSNEYEWIWDAVDPLNPSALVLPFVVLQAVPATITLLAIVGFVAGLRRWAAVGLLPITTLVLFRLYHSAAHGSEYEILRYVTMVMPAVMVMVLLGWRATAAFFDRLQGRRTRIRVGVALAAGLLVGLPMPDRGGPHPAPFDSADRLLLSRNRQVAARFLLHAVEEHPGCVFFTPTRDGEWVAFGVPVPAPVTVDSPTMKELDGVVDAESCALLYEGLDCNLERSNADCGLIEAEGVPLDVRTFPSRPYLDPDHGIIGDVVRLGVFRY
ncbi:MAG: hypothetical protein ACQEXJ_22360 [Myxococcota bacterium]